MTDFGVGFWDVDSGRSQAWTSSSGDVTTCNDHPSGRCSSSFEIIGVAVPEARTRDLAVAGLLLAVIAGYRRRSVLRR